MANLPEYSSRFLNSVCRRLAARRKSLSHRGKLTWETEQPDEFEWLSVYFDPYSGNYCIFQFAESNHISIYVRSKRRKDRGKVLLAIEGMKVVDNADTIIEAVESTIHHSGAMNSDDPSHALQEIHTAWSRVQVRISSEPGE